MHAIFYSGNLEGRYHMGELGVDGREIEECGMRAWSRLMALERMG
jgi:hypothetical protein